jgi:ribosomal protein S16
MPSRSRRSSRKPSGIDALIFTKMDGDARGGAALSVREVTGRPIAFVGVGEKTDALEPFHPDRLASRILGMGDVLSLVEKAQEAVDQKTAEAMIKKLREDNFTLDDFRQQLKQVRQMGPLDQVLGMIPGLGKMMKGGMGDLAGEQKDLDRFDAIISSMTPGERTHPEVVNGSRRQRIARGSGTSVSDVNRLLKQHAQLRKMMKQFKGMEGKLGRMKGLPGFPSLRGVTDVSVSIRLRRMGSSRRPAYRVVVADSRSPRDGRFIEVIGHYNPLTQPPTVKIDRTKAQEWISKGAQPSNTVKRLMQNVKEEAQAK